MKPANLDPAEKMRSLQGLVKQLRTAEQEKDEAARRCAEFQLEHADEIDEPVVAAEAAALQAQVMLSCARPANLRKKAATEAVRSVDHVQELNQRLRRASAANEQTARAISRKRLEPYFTPDVLDSAIGQSALVREEAARACCLPNCRAGIAVHPMTRERSLASSCTAETLVEDYERIMAALAFENHRAEELRRFDERPTGRSS